MANTQSSEPTNQSEQNPASESPRETTTDGGDDEFKITVKKLDVIVKPRGVLAE